MENQFESLELSPIISEELSEPSQDLSTNTDEKWSMDARSSCDEKVQFEEIDKMATGGPSTSGRMPSKSPRQREPMEKTPMSKSRARSNSRGRAKGKARPQSRSTSRSRRSQKGPTKVSRGRSSSKSRFNSSLHPRDATGRFVSKNRHAY